MLGHKIAVCLVLTVLSKSFQNLLYQSLLPSRKLWFPLTSHFIQHLLLSPFNYNSSVCVCPSYSLICTYLISTALKQLFLFLGVFDILIYYYYLSDYLYFVLLIYGIKKIQIGELTQIFALQIFSLFLACSFFCDFWLIEVINFSDEQIIHLYFYGYWFLWRV